MLWQDQRPTSCTTCWALVLPEPNRFVGDVAQKVSQVVRIAEFDHNNSDVKSFICDIASVLPLISQAYYKRMIKFHEQLLGISCSEVLYQFPPLPKEMIEKVSACI
jgi:hypothetical protein